MFCLLPCLIASLTFSASLLSDSFLDKYLSCHHCPSQTHFFQGSCGCSAMGYTKLESNLRGTHDSQCTDQDGTHLGQQNSKFSLKHINHSFWRSENGGGLLASVSQESRQTSLRSHPLIIFLTETGQSASR